MENDFKPAVQHQRRVNLKIHEVIKKEVIKLLDAGLIYPISDSPWVSPVHCVPKKGSMTVVENEDNELIPTRFQRCMMAIFYDMIEETMEVFMDDFLVFGDSFSSCLSHLDKMLKRCEDTNLVLNWEKCHFMVKEGIVLSHKISKSGIEVDRAKVDVIVKLPHPTSVKVACRDLEAAFEYLGEGYNGVEVCETFYACSDSLLLTPLCCDDIHDVTPRVSALAGCDTKQVNLGVSSERMTFLIDSAMKHSYSNDDTCFSIDVIYEILEEDFDALLDEGSEILHSIEGTILEEKLFAEFNEFIAMNIEEKSESESNTEEPPFEKIIFNTDYKIKTSLEEPPSDLELKPLPDHLKI
ncbi:DNA-directed DNA polymerase [Tanacetum coccineum]